jgi:hypothetical protein
MGLALYLLGLNSWRSSVCCTAPLLARAMALSIDPSPQTCTHRQPGNARQLQVACLGNGYKATYYQFCMMKGVVRLDLLFLAGNLCCLNASMAAI